MPASDRESDSPSWWSVLGLGGALSLCCLGTTTVAGAAAGGALAGSVAVGGLIEFLVTMVTVAAIAFGFRLRSRYRSDG